MCFFCFKSLFISSSKFTNKWPKNIDTAALTAAAAASARRRGGAAARRQRAVVVVTARACYASPISKLNQQCIIRPTLLFFIDIFFLNIKNKTLNKLGRYLLFYNDRFTYYNANASYVIPIYLILSSPEGPFTFILTDDISLVELLRYLHLILLREHHLYLYNKAPSLTFY